MAATTTSPREVARQASKVMGRTVTDKQVRGIARDTLARFDKTKHPAYQSHEYSAAEVRSLLAVFTARRSGGRVAKPKTRTVARKSAQRAKSAAQTAPASDSSDA